MKSTCDFSYNNWAVAAGVKVYEPLGKGRHETVWKHVGTDIEPEMRIS